METLPPLLISEHTTCLYLMYSCVREVSAGSGCQTHLHACRCMIRISPTLIMHAVAGAIAAMGSLQQLSQWATMGKPKAVGVDPWDREVPSCPASFFGCDMPLQLDKSRDGLPLSLK